MRETGRQTQTEREIFRLDGPYKHGTGAYARAEVEPSFTSDEVLGLVNLKKFNMNGIHCAAGEVELNYGVVQKVLLRHSRPSPYAAEDARQGFGRQSQEFKI